MTHFLPSTGGYWPLLKGWLAGLLELNVTRFVVIPDDMRAANILETVAPGKLFALYLPVVRPLISLLLTTRAQAACNTSI